MDELARIELEGDASLRVARLSGEIDISNAAAVEKRLRELLDDSAAVLDLSGLSYLDSAGIRLLFRLGEALRGRLRLVLGERSPVRRVLEIAGADRLLALETVPATAESGAETEPLSRARRQAEEKQPL
ncbi:MAG: STAS domain-containing protein [Gaiellaceae bacterium]